MRSTIPPPSTLDAALGPLASCSDRQLQLKMFGVLSFIRFPTCLPSSSDRCLLLLKVGCNSMFLGFLVSVKLETGEGIEPVALLLSDLDESTRGPSACGQ